jgi:hypothetical protein
MSARNSVSIAGSASDALIISGQGNQVTVYLAAGAIQVAEPAARDDPLGPNPYRGLAAFFEEDADRLFGRDKQVARLWEAYRAFYEALPGVTPRRILSILGPSVAENRRGHVPALCRKSPGMLCRR